MMFGKKSKPKELTREEKLDILISKAAELLVSEAQAKVPEHGDFKRVFVTFTIPETEVIALLIVIPSNTPEERRIQLGTKLQGTDRLYSNYYFKGTKQEVIRHLQDPGNRPKMLSLLLNLCNTTEDYFS